LRWYNEALQNEGNDMALGTPGFEITRISNDLVQSSTLVLPDVTKLLVPAPRPLRCDLYYRAVRPTTGKIASVELGGSEVASISYSGDSGPKHVSFDLSSVTPGNTLFRMRCVVARLPLEDKSDEAVIWLFSGPNTVVKKSFVTTLPIEPFDQNWTLAIT
jgi:hypothetical protein